jgi:hypothetical protein
VSIVRVGLAETKGFSDGYDAIFRGKRPSAAKANKKNVKKKAPAKAKKKK